MGGIINLMRNFMIDRRMTERLGDRWVARRNGTAEFILNDTMKDNACFIFLLFSSSFHAALDKNSAGCVRPSAGRRVLVEFFFSLARP